MTHDQWLEKISGELTPYPEQCSKGHEHWPDDEEWDCGRWYCPTCEEHVEIEPTPW